MNADELIEKVSSWSEHDDRVIAAGICGSHARGEARPDSDIDFCILTPDPSSLLEDRSWIYDFGADAQVARNTEDYNLVQSIRAFYGTTEAEFGVTDQAWVQLPIDPETAGVMNNGLLILYDPEGHLEKAVVYAESMRTVGVESGLRFMHYESGSETRSYWWLTVLVAAIAVIGPLATGIGTAFAKLGLFTGGHPSLAGLIYVFGRAWMHFVCPVGVVVGVGSIILSVRNETGAHWKMLSLWTLVNLIQALTVIGWP